MQDYVIDADSPANHQRSFYIVYPITIIGDRLMEELRDRNELQVFVVDRSTGIVTTNVYFADSMQGYFNIKLFVNDSVAGHNDTAEASVSHVYTVTSMGRKGW